MPQLGRLDETFSDPGSGRPRVGASVIKSCAACKHILPIEAFGVDRKRRDGLGVYCRACGNLANRKSYHKDVVRSRKQSLAKRLRRHEHYKALTRARCAAIKQEMIDMYGSSCACCGEHRKEFLSIEHIGGGGKAHRRIVGAGGVHMYRDLKRRGWPKDKYELLCMNCNFSQNFNKTCPHMYEIANAMLVA